MNYSVVRSKTVGCLLLNMIDVECSLKFNLCVEVKGVFVMKSKVVIIGILMALFVIFTTGFSALAQEEYDCIPYEEAKNAEFDPALIAPMPTDLESLEQALLSDIDHTMLGQEGNEVRFIVYDKRLPDGQGFFSFNTKTFFLSYEGDESLVKFANEVTDKGGDGGLLTGCYY